jgi:hypothetical protein
MYYLGIIRKLMRPLRQKWRWLMLGAYDER